MVMKIARFFRTRHTPPCSCGFTINLPAELTDCARVLGAFGWCHKRCSFDAVIRHSWAEWGCQTSAPIVVGMDCGARVLHVQYVMVFGVGINAGVVLMIELWLWGNNTVVGSSNLPAWNEFAQRKILGVRWFWHFRKRWVNANCSWGG